MQEKSARPRGRVTSAWALGAWLMVSSLACSERAPAVGVQQVYEGVQVSVPGGYEVTQDAARGWRAREPVQTRCGGVEVSLTAHEGPARALTLTRAGERCETLRYERAGWGKLLRCEAHGELEGRTPPTPCDAIMASFASHP